MQYTPTSMQYNSNSCQRGSGVPIRLSRALLLIAHHNLAYLDVSQKFNPQFLVRRGKAHGFRYQTLFKILHLNFTNSTLLLILLVRGTFPVRYLIHCHVGSPSGVF